MLDHGAGRQRIPNENSGTMSVLFRLNEWLMAVPYTELIQLSLRNLYEGKFHTSRDADSKA